MKSLFFLTLLLSPILIGSASEGVATAGKFAAYGSVAGYLIFSLSSFTGRIRTDIKIFYSLIIFCFYLFIRSVNSTGVLLFFQFSLVTVFFFHMSAERGLTQSSVRRNFIICYFIFLISFIFEISFGWYANRNFTGVFSLVYTVLFYSVCRNTFVKNAVVLLALMMVAASGARSVLVGAVFSLLYCYLFFVNRSSTQVKLFLASAILFAMALSLYLTFDLRDSFALNDWFLQNTGKRFETGRLDIWGNLLSNFDLPTYIFGLGGGFNLGELTGLDERLSAHSLYIYMIASYGVLGLCLLMYIFLLGLIRNWRLDYVFAFFSSLMLIGRDFFEVSLVHNNFPLALIFWGIFMSGFVDRYKSIRN